MLQEHLWYWQNILRRLEWAFLARLMGGMAMLFSKPLFESPVWLVGLGLSLVSSQEPRTEYHPSLSACSGRFPSRGDNPRGSPCSSFSTSEIERVPPNTRVLQLLKKKANQDLHRFCVTVSKCTVSSYPLNRWNIQAHVKCWTLTL